MATEDAKFNGLADSYDKARPRYPEELFARAVELLPPGRPPVVVDAGAGTGIALEGLLPRLPGGSSVYAVDVSEDMIRVGRAKFPDVEWRLGTAEDHLVSGGQADLVLAAQSYQWMDRPRFLRCVAGHLGPSGVCMIVQNNRDHTVGGFAAAYEDLLEKYSPGYTRSYRTIDVEGELSAHFPRVEVRECTWVQALTIDDFVEMSSSSTQAQRAVADVGPVFLDHVRDLCAAHADNGAVHVPYVSQAFFGLRQ